MSKAKREYKLGDAMIKREGGPLPAEPGSKVSRETAEDNGWSREAMEDAGYRISLSDDWVHHSDPGVHVHTTQRKPQLSSKPPFSKKGVNFTEKEVLDNGWSNEQMEDANYAFDVIAKIWRNWREVKGGLFASPSHPSGISPMEYKVVVRLTEELGYVELKGGFKIYKPDETKERDQHAASEGVVVAVSPTAFTFEDGAPKAEPGQTVLFARYSGVTVKGNDGVDYRIMNDKDIMAVRA